MAMTQVSISREPRCGAIHGRHQEIPLAGLILPGGTICTAALLVNNAATRQPDILMLVSITQP
jgi:hypothetical protein